MHQNVLWSLNNGLIILFSNIHDYVVLGYKEMGVVQGIGAIYKISVYHSWFYFKEPTKKLQNMRLTLRRTGYTTKHCAATSHLHTSCDKCFIYMALPYNICDGHCYYQLYQLGTGGHTQKAKLKMAPSVLLIAIMVTLLFYCICMHACMGSYYVYDDHFN